MSRPTSGRNAKNRDWRALAQAIEGEQASVTPEAHALWMSGKWCDPRPNANAEYLIAMQLALDSRDAAPLLGMLDAGMPMSEQLLPVLAQVIRDAQQGLSSGRPAALTNRDDDNVRWLFDMATKDHRGVGKTHLYLADCLNVSVDTIKRSLRRTKPAEG